MKYSSRYTITVHGSKTGLIGPISAISFLGDTDELLQPSAGERCGTRINADEHGYSKKLVS